MNTKFLLAASVMVALAACTPPGAPTAEAPVAPPPVVLPTQTDVDAALAKIDAAVKAKDAVAVAALYAPGAVFVDPMENAVAKTDPAGLLAGVTAWMKMEPTLSTNTRETQILDADTFVVSGLETLDFKRNGRATWIVQRFTQVWQKQADGQWLIATEHLSNAPRPVPARLPPLVGAATAEQNDAPPLGGATATPTPAPEPEKK